MDKSISKINKRLDDIEKNVQKMILSVGNAAKNEIGLAFEQEKSPFGAKWAELSDATKKRKKSPLKLYEKGDLRSRWTLTKRTNEVIITNSAKANGFAYGLTHQYGSNRAGRGRKVKIPARPFLPIADDRLSDSLKKIIKKSYKEIFGE